MRVQSGIGPLFGDCSNRIIRVLDTPGLLDPRVDMDQVIPDISDALRRGTVDAIVIPA